MMINCPEPGKNFETESNGLLEALKGKLCLNYIAVDCRSSSC